MWGAVEMNLRGERRSRTASVLYALWDLPFERVEVFSDKNPVPPELKEDYAGIVRSDLMHDCPSWGMQWQPDFRIDRARQHWERLICIFLAGQLAEWRHSLNTGCRMAAFTGRLDQRDIRFLCRHLLGCPTRSLWFKRVHRCHCSLFNARFCLAY